MFKAIKAELTIALVLAYFSPKADHIIQVDGSMKGLCVFPMQKGRSVIYVSRTLMQTETSSSTIETELLSVVFGLERLHHYVFGSRVEVQTLHKPLIPVWKKSIAVASPNFNAYYTNKV